jgi:dolichyl-phosphate-mannose-protein mannosyltransferase
VRQWPRPSAHTSRAGGPFAAARDLLTFGIALVLVVRLAGFASGARFAFDECFHAYMSEWIAGHTTLPREVAGLYSGFKYFYPPLFHVAGAAVVRLFGAGAFAFLNVGLLAALLAVTWLGVRRLHSRAAAGAAVLVLIGCPWLQIQGVRLYVEALSALLAVASLLAWLALVRRPTTWRAIGLGVLVGLAALAKQSGLVLVGALAGLAVLWVVRRDGSLARSHALALGVAIATALPHWVRNAVLFGSPIYPVFGPDIHRGLEQLNRAGFTPGAPAFFRQILQDAGAVLPILVPAGLAVAIWRHRDPEHAALGAAAAALLAAPFLPMVDPRHAVPLIACLAVLATIALMAELERRPLLHGGLQALLLIMAAIAVITMPNHRERLDLAKEMDEVWDAIEAHVPKDATILSLATYDTFYYTGRPTTWPIPWGQRDPPIEMFDDAQPDRILAHLRRRRIDFLVVPGNARGHVFTSANFPIPFMSGLRALVDRGDVDLVWTGQTQVLLRVSRTGGRPPIF